MKNSNNSEVIFDPGWEKRSNKLVCYSPVFYIRELKKESHHEYVGRNIKKYFEGNANRYKTIEIDVDGYKHYFLAEYKEWDTNFFKTRTFFFYTALYNHTDFIVLCKAVKKFKEIMINDFKCEYVFSNIPSEDIQLVQALGVNGFRLVTSNLTYYLKLKDFSYEREFQVRHATIEDIPSLRHTASTEINEYDRFMAEFAFDPDISREFLAKYIEEGVKGLFDLVIVPGAGSEEPAGFAATSLKNDLDCFDAKIAYARYTAVDKEKRIGWFLKLYIEAMKRIKEAGYDYSYNTSQTANIPMIKFFEKIGSKYGCVSHVFTYSTIIQNML